MGIRHLLIIRFSWLFWLTGLLFLPAMAWPLETGFKLYTLAERTEVADASQNPDNRLARMPDQSLTTVFKADLCGTYDKWQVYARPRLKLRWHRSEFGGQNEEKRAESAEIMEFSIQRVVTDSLFSAYGWENLQWGPGFLYSPSNPFFTDNGKKNLIQDFEGKGMAKLVWVKDFHWSFSLICNTDKGAVEASGFKKNYALKIDYAAGQGYGSAILSYKDHGRARMGVYAGATATDALIIYGEASFQQGSDALYPRPIKGSCLAWEMVPEKEGSHKIFSTFLAGAGYTFESGNSLTLEYLYYGPGYDSRTASDFQALTHTAAGFYTSGASGDALAGYGEKLLGQAADNGRDFLRQNYLLVQYLNDTLLTDMDLVSRMTHCLDDGSCRWYSSLSYALNNNIELKAAAMVNTGGYDKSFTRFMDGRIQAAVEYSY